MDVAVSRRQDSNVRVLWSVRSRDQKWQALSYGLPRGQSTVRRCMILILYHDPCCYTSPVLQQPANSVGPTSPRYRPWFGFSIMYIRIFPLKLIDVITSYSFCLFPPQLMPLFTNIVYNIWHSRITTFEVSSNT